MYPDPKVQDLLKEFVCIRVEHDREKALVAQYGVKSLPDLRFLDSEGKPLDRIVGFAGVEKLVARGRGALDRLRGGAGTAARAEPMAARRTLPANEQTIAQATAGGIAFLKAARKKEAAATPGLNPDDLVLFAWIACGVKADDPDRAALEKAVLAAPLQGTYQASLRALAFSCAGDKRYQDALSECARFLVNIQLANGQWTYGSPKPGEIGKLGDNSNTAYALLGLAACRAAGIAVPEDPFDKARGWWRATQNPDGGWGYRTDREAESYASMTESALGSLRLLDRGPAEAFHRDPLIRKGFDFLKKRFSVKENAGSGYQEGRLVYHLFALERLGVFTGSADIAGHDWFREGAEFLLAAEHEDGSWDDGSETPVPNTCFALLFLNRATRGLIGGSMDRFGETRFGFDGDRAGRLPPDWEIAATNPSGDLAVWEVVPDPEAPGIPNVLAIRKIRDDSSGVFNLCWNRKIRFKDGEIEVKVRADSGEEDQGGGLIWRAQDAGNYYIARYNPLEGNFRLYVVKNGKRKQLASASDLDIKSGEWFSIRIVHRGERIEGWLDGKKLLDATDRTFPDVGGAGFWTKADAASSFDDLVTRADAKR